jgi:type I restriction enzyme R subunit
MTTLLRGDSTIKFVGSDEYVPMMFIDFEDLSNNTFVVSDEVILAPRGMFVGLIWCCG